MKSLSRFNIFFLSMFFFSTLLCQNRLSTNFAYASEDSKEISMSQLNLDVFQERDRRQLEQASLRWDRAKRNRERQEETRKKALSDLRGFRSNLLSRISQVEERLIGLLENARKKAADAQRELEEFESQYDDRLLTEKNKIYDREKRLEERYESANKRFQDALIAEQEAYEALRALELRLQVR